MSDEQGGVGVNPRSLDQNLAELAAAGYALLRQPMMQIDFEVHHVADKPGYLFDHLTRAEDGNGSESAHHFIETLSTFANGSGLVVGTRTGAGNSLLYNPNSSSSSDSVEVLRSRGNVYFRGTARPNPSFTHSSSRVFEAIICIDHSDRVAVWFRRSVEIKRLIAFVASLAADGARAPILSAQWPAQVPPSVRSGSAEMDPLARRDGPIPPVASLALRFSIALPRTSAERRIDLSNRLREYCESRGFGLWLADGRIGYQTGCWFHICNVGIENTSSHAVPEGEDRIKVFLPVTFVGPARVGSTNAIMNFLNELPFVGVLASSNTTLDDLAFIHLQLTWEGSSPRTLVEVNKSLTGREIGSGSPGDILVGVFDALGFRHKMANLKRGASALDARAWDYKTLIGRVFPYVPAGARRMAFWCLWEMQEDSRGLETPLAGLYRAFDRVGFPSVNCAEKSRDRWPNVEYLICRKIDEALVRGKGKISVLKEMVDKNYAGAESEHPASRVAAMVEAAWKDELGAESNVRETRIVWRESWLNHWSPSIY